MIAGTDDCLFCSLEPETVPMTAFHTDDFELCFIKVDVSV